MRLAVACAARQALAREERKHTALGRVTANGCRERLAVQRLVREGTDVARVVRVGPLIKA